VHRDHTSHSLSASFTQDGGQFSNRCTDDFNGAQLKAVCVEAGMLALRRDATEIHHEDFVEGITQVQTKKKASLAYYA